MAINDPFIDTDYLIYLLSYDSVHGKFQKVAYKIFQAASRELSRRLKVESK